MALRDKQMKIDIVARDKSKKALNRVKANLSGVRKSVFNLRNAFIGLGAGLAIRSIVNTGKEIESLQIRLKFLFGSVEEGAKAFDNMAKFAGKVPFSLDEIQQGAGNLAVVSKNADELANILEITGNVAAITGLDFQTTATQIQRSFSGGIAAADIFRERGVRNMLGFSAGAKVSAEETIEAFQRVFGSGGEFGKATDELSKTFAGTMSMLGDKVFNFKKTIVEKGFFPELKKQFGDLNQFMADNQATLDRYAESIGVGLAKAVRTLGDAIVFVKDNFDLFKGMVGGFIAFKFAGIVIGIVKGLKDMYLVLVGITALSGPKGLGMIAVAFGAVAGASIFLKGQLDSLGSEFDHLSKEELDQKIKKTKDEIKELTKESEILNKKLSELTPTAEDWGIELQKEDDFLGSVNDKLYVAPSLYESVLQQLTKNTAKLLELNSELDSLEGSLTRTNTAWKSAVEIMGEIHDAKEKSKADFQKMLDDLRAEKEAIERAKRLELQVYYQYYFSRKRLMDSELKAEQEYNERAAEINRLYAVYRLRGQELDFQKEREQAKNNFHAMLDMAHKHEAAKAKIRKEATAHTISESRSALETLATMNKRAFEAFKAVRIAEAIISTWRGATKALEQWGWPWGAVAAAATVAKGMAMVAQIQSTSYRGRQQGGMVKQGQPYMVGEAGKELFVPNQSGKIVPNHDLGKAVTVNFNINTVDARGFNELLVNSRGVIVNMINNAVNEKGRQAII